MDSAKILKQVPRLLLPWYRQNARDLPFRQTTDPYAVWISEVMLQQTRMAAVLPYYARFTKCLPDIKSLAMVSDENLMRLWEGLGYYSRARNLKKAAQILVRDYGGMLPENYSELRALPGIGDYTAAAIASICYGLPYPAIDGNVLRVWARLLAVPDSIDALITRRRVYSDLAPLYPKNPAAQLNQALMELGSEVCIPRGHPRCDACPLNPICSAAKTKNPAAFPIRTKKKKRRVETYTVFILRFGNEIALRRRSDEGVLAGMWELPNIPGLSNETEALAALANWEVSPLELKQSVERRHIFTHIEWKMRGFYFTVCKKESDFIWTDFEENRLPLPTAFRKFLKEENV